VSENELEPLPCANCGRPLPDPLAPCRFCEGPDGRPDPPGAMEVFRLRRRARAQLLMGVDSWPFALLAAWTAKRGLALEEASLDPDLGTLRRLRRIFLLALLFAGLGIAYAFFLLVKP
jgi:hypothetical protein